MQARILVILLIVFNSFFNLVSGQINIQGTTQAQPDAKALRESRLKRIKLESQFALDITPTEIYLGDYEIIDGQKKQYGLSIIERDGATIYKSNYRDSLLGLTTNSAYIDQGHNTTVEFSKEGIINIAGSLSVKIYPNGNCYFRDCLVSKNGNIFFGTQIKGEYNCWQGELHLADGSVYTGEFKNSQFTGKGIFYDIAGTKYEGTFLNGLKNGEGILATSELHSQSPTGTVYTREKYINGEKQKLKKNVLKDKPSDYYSAVMNSTTGNEGMDTSFYDRVGYMNFPLRQLRSKMYILTRVAMIADNSINVIYRYRDGRIEFPGYEYSGYTTNIIIYPNKEMYFGDTRKQNANLDYINYKGGKGIYLYNNGDIFIGQFCGDGRCGFVGMMIFKNGDVCSGQFNNDKMSGEISYIDKAKKEKFFGTYKNGVRDGEGVIYSADGTSRKVVYQDGILQ